MQTLESTDNYKITVDEKIDADAFTVRKENLEIKIRDQWIHVMEFYHTENRDESVLVQIAKRFDPARGWLRISGKGEPSDQKFNETTTFNLNKDGSIAKFASRGYMFVIWDFETIVKIWRKFRRRDDI